MKRALLTLALLASMATPLPAKVLVVCEQMSSYGTSGDDPALTRVTPLLAVQRVLSKWKRRYGEDYVVMSPDAVNTEMVRTGIVYATRLGDGFNTTSRADTFSAVIHVNFNGSGTTAYADYRPDSLTRTVKLPTVPQLFIVDPHAYAGDFGVSAAGDSNWVSGFDTGNAGYHDMEASHWVPGDARVVLGGLAPAYFLKRSGSPNGGVRTLLNATLNAWYQRQTSGVMSPNPDSCLISGAGEDSMLVYEKLNLHKAGSARIVYAAPFNTPLADSAGTQSYFDTEVDWFVLTFAMAHLDSLTGGDVLGTNAQGVGFVLTHGGGRSDRRHPGGIFDDDTAILSNSCDSLASIGARVVVAADPESLSASDAAILKRIGQVRFTPYVRTGLDTLALGADGDASTTTPVDVWGRYRNRALYGDGSAAGADTSVWALYLASRSDLSSLVGSGFMSNLMVAPDDDFSPYQMRRNQNTALWDSVLWVASKLGCPAILVNSWGRDMDPGYLTTNPRGWIYKQGTHTVHASSQRGARVRLIAHSQPTVRGSQVGARDDGGSFMGPYVAYADSATSWVAYNNAASYSMYAFYSSFFGPSRSGIEDGFSVRGGGDFTVYDDINAFQYRHEPASVLMLPMQSLGGQDVTAPNRWGYFAIKGLVNGIKLINAKAGRTVLRNDWPEAIEP